MCSLQHLLLLVYFTWCLSCQFVLFLALVKHKFLMVSLSSNSICTLIHKKLPCSLQNPLLPCRWCHEIELMVEWMLHDLSTLTSPDEWSEKNEELWKEKGWKILSLECLRNVRWINVEWINETLFNMQRRKINCLNDPSQNKTVKWLNIYLCFLFLWFSYF